MRAKFIKKNISNFDDEVEGFYLCFLPVFCKLEGRLGVVVGAHCCKIYQAFGI